MSTLREWLEGFAVFAIALIVLWVASGGPLLWLAAHFILNGRI